MVCILWQNEDSGLELLSWINQRYVLLNFLNPNEKVYVWICLTIQSQMTRSVLTISFWVIYVWLCRDSTDFFSTYLSGKAIYVWLCRDFDFHTEQCSAENRPTFRQVCFAEQGLIFSLGKGVKPMRFKCQNNDIKFQGQY